VTLIDYYGSTAFKRAMISPAIIILSNKWNKNTFTYVKKTKGTFESYEYEQDKLKDTCWIILKDEEEKLFEKIDGIANTYIRDICSIKQGIITGLDKALGSYFLTGLINFLDAGMLSTTLSPTAAVMAAPTAPAS
jgi:adenine-specific DNA-methyltransferase